MKNLFEDIIHTLLIILFIILMIGAIMAVFPFIMEILAAIFSWISRVF